jgi:hypothetical protein
LELTILCNINQGRHGNVMVNAGHSLRLMKQANSRLLLSAVGQWAIMPYQDVMHEADDTKDNQREWLGPREGSA